MIGYIPDRVVFHHSAGLGSFAAIRKAHKAKGWKDIGYNLVVGRDGELYHGRPIGTQPAANGRGNNSGTVAVCGIGNNLVGRQEWNSEQAATLQRVYDGLRILFPGITLLGHRETKATACPGLDIHALLT